MADNIIDLESRRPPPNPGNGSREVLIELTRTAPQLYMDEAENWSDWLLGSLWVRGFKIVPLDGNE